MSQILSPLQGIPEPFSKTRYSNSQDSSQTSNEGFGRDNDPEPDATLCVELCVGLEVELWVALNVKFDARTLLLLLV